MLIPARIYPEKFNYHAVYQISKQKKTAKLQ